MDFTRYPGAKTNSGIIQFLINRIPFHARYFELYAGSASLFYAKKPAPVRNILTDRDIAVINEHNRRVPQLDAYCCSAVDFIISDRMKFCPSDFIYLDPPYRFAVRRTGKKYYKFEMTDADHVQLLKTVLQLDANVMISTREGDELYDEYLQGWRKDSFETVDRQGAVTEVVYMNYQQPAILHQYNYWGGDCWERQGVKRKIARFEKKIKQLPVYEQHLFIQTMIKENPELVQHFMLNRE